MKNIEMGMRVKTLVTKEAYYGGIIPIGTIGEVGAVNCIPVYGPGKFTCVDFVVDGEQKRASYKSNQIETAQV